MRDLRRPPRLTASCPSLVILYLLSPLFFSTQKKKKKSHYCSCNSDVLLKSAAGTYNGREPVMTHPIRDEEPGTRERPNTSQVSFHPPLPQTACFRAGQTCLAQVCGEPGADSSCVMSGAYPSPGALPNGIQSAPLIPSASLAAEPR